MLGYIREPGDIERWEKLPGVGGECLIPGWPFAHLKTVPGRRRRIPEELRFPGGFGREAGRIRGIAPSRGHGVALLQRGSPRLWHGARMDNYEVSDNWGVSGDG